MKKIACLALALMMLFSYAYAVTNVIDYASMTTQELKKNLSVIRNELQKRIVKSEKDQYLYSDNDIEIYFTGKGKRSTNYFDLEIVFVNLTDQTLSINIDSISINGWECGSYIPSIGSTTAGKRRKDYLRLNFVDANLDDFRDMQEVEVIFHTYGENYQTVKKYGPIMFEFNGSSWN